MDHVPGPVDKVYSTRNAALMYLPHSAVGYYAGWASRLFSTDRLPDGRYTPYAAASVHGWIPQAGTPIQHYPIWASCWASGSRYPNTMGVAFENEGGPPGNEGEPLTPWQVACNVRIIKDLAAFRQWATVRRPVDDNDVGAQLYEHRECKRWGSAATACPSGRIPWDKLLQEDEMSKDDMLAAALQFGSDEIKLVRGSGPTVYVVDWHGKRVFPGGAPEFTALGFEWHDVIVVADAVLAKVPDA